MDVLKVKIEMPDTKRYMEKIKWSQMEVQKKLLSVKSGKQPGTDKIRGEIYKWMASSEVCTEKIRMAINKVMEEPRWKINSFLSEISVCWSCTEKITLKIERAFSVI